MSLSRTASQLQPCIRCLLLPILSPSRPLHTTPPRLRLGYRMGYRQEPFPDPSTSADPDQPNPINPHLTPKAFQPTPPPPSRRLVDILLSRLPEWTQSQRALRKLEAYGLTDAHRHLRRWVDTVNDGLGGCESDEEASAALVGGGWDEVNLTQSFDRDGAGFAGTLEAAFMRRFLTYCTTSEGVSRPLKTHLKSLLDVTDLSRIAFTGDNTRARAMRRNFHLHIGPTNSGKTYSALKSLARATSGAYAGPLRLLAHEVWERLNLGTVGGLDGESKKCNLLTGEERRIVDPDAALLSCTIEMLPFGGPLGGQGYEVVVIDEIQMMGDPHRGGSWTKAVLGVRAKEVHLCGDQTTVDLLSTLITSLGDTLTIHRYDRLTPLTVAEESLEGDFNKVEAGDCIVTFSRSNIFSVKKMIEEKTGRKCAVVYGALPPETRAEQARDFNDENGIAEVLVASDAVGMGLNLWVGPFCDNPDGKIKRMVFESLQKFNGRTEVPLSLTQIKQIAGRAGRYGMHKPAVVTPLEEDEIDEEEEEPAAPDEVPQLGGIVTTLHKADLPVLRALLPLPLPPLRRATLDIPFDTMSDLSILLPQGTPFAHLLDHLNALALLPANTVPGAFDQKVPLADVLEPVRDRLSLIEMDLFTYSPVSVRDPNAINIFTNIVRAFAETGLVDLDEVFGPSRLLTTLDMAEATLATLPPLPPILGIGRRLLTPPILVSSIPVLETLHKSLVMYIWLSFRLEVSFPDRLLAQSYKDRTEVVLEACLERLPGLRQKKTYERSREMDGKVAAWRREYVSPNGTVKMTGAGGKKGIEWMTPHIQRRLKEREMWRGAKVAVDAPEARGVEQDAG